MSISRTCRSCGSPLPEHLSDGTCPSCGSVQALNETPKASGTPEDREGDFVVGSPNDLTASMHPEEVLASTVVAEPPAPVRPARRPVPELEGYRDVAFLNSGGMGDVYRGIQTGTERRVAIKVMRPTASAYSQNRERFEKEIRALARVDHPGVVRVYECGECPQGPYFSMEFVDGETLSRRVKREGTFEPHEAARIVRQAAEAVHCAHRVDVLHRDIKPGNIILAPDGTVKVTDFGLAKHTDEEESEELTETGIAVGTPSYIPPEQANGDADALGPASDVYGLGGTLYHLLTGSPPHAAYSPARSLRLAQFEDVLPAKDRRPDLCPILNAIVEKSLAREPADRYDSAEQFAHELRNWSGGEPTIAVPPNRLQRVGRWIRRNRVAVLLLAMFAAVGGMAALVRQQLDEKGRIERALARGETVTLIGPTGLPKWHDWAILPGSLFPSQRGDKTSGMQSQRYSGLILVEDPMTDHYRFRAQIRHDGGMRSGDLANKTTNLSSKVGLFWGRQKLEADGRPADTLLSFDFNDLTRNTGAKPEADDVPQPIRIHGRSFIEVPEVGMKKYEVGIAVPKYFVSKGERQGIWRELEIEVHPDICIASWASVAGEPRKVVARITPEQLNALQDAGRRFLNSKHPAGWPIPEWTPRRPLGILGMLSTISIRNAVIEPLAAPAAASP